METRESATDFINSGECAKGWKEAKNGKGHFGKYELKRLLDFIYQGEPKEIHEKIIDLDGVEGRDG